MTNSIKSPVQGRMKSVLHAEDHVRDSFYYLIMYCKWWYVHSLHNFMLRKVFPPFIDAGFLQIASHDFWMWFCFIRSFRQTHFGLMGILFPLEYYMLSISNSKTPELVGYTANAFCHRFRNSSTPKLQDFNTKHRCACLFVHLPARVSRCVASWRV